MHGYCCSCPFEYTGPKCQTKTPNNCTNQTPALQPCSGKCVSKASICSRNKNCGYSDTQIKFNCGGKELPRGWLNIKITVPFFRIIWTAWIVERELCGTNESLPRVSLWAAPWSVWFQRNAPWFISFRLAAVFATLCYFQLKISFAKKQGSKNQKLYKLLILRGNTCTRFSAVLSFSLTIYGI